VANPQNKISQIISFSVGNTSFLFMLVLLGSNRPIKRVFSIINALWSNEKTDLKTVKALTIVNTHFKDLSCSEIFSQRSKEKVFLEQVHKSDKYSGDSGKAFAEQDLLF
jgi:hypothetical protein